jgi:hypothetical protein
MTIRFSTFATHIGMPCFYTMLAAHHALHSPDMKQALSNYNVTGEYGLVWC